MNWGDWLTAFKWTVGIVAYVASVAGIWALWFLGGTWVLDKFDIDRDTSDHIAGVSGLVIAIILLIAGCAGVWEALER